MKTTIVTLAVSVAALTVIACSAGSADEQAGSSGATSTASSQTAPVSTEAERAWVEALRAIDPDLVYTDASSIRNGKSTCLLIHQVDKGETSREQLTSTTQARFTRSGTVQITPTPAQTAQIIAAAREHLCAQYRGEFDRPPYTQE